ncbi:hypothetical protein DESPIG_01533 [Desulfovibrio piger ATCC 29098]|uniref:Uncharacterized protein n=1 Tax=Desulfovibrio piger ATCC 29098 TaxID=411464 RepID=B6WTX6_9BACT|nr:hypothetical protein DESPIG_01533 [Desulfovibrio piger ATCC 29098]
MAFGQDRLSGRGPVPCRDCPFAGGVRVLSLPPGPFPSFWLRFLTPEKACVLSQDC